VTYFFKQKLLELVIGMPRGWRERIPVRVDGC